MAAQAQPHVLLIDDDEQLAEAVRQYLELENFKVTVLHGGKEAIEWFKSNQPPHIVLLDIMMPQVDGFALLQFMRKQASTQHTPVIIFTALSDQTTMERIKSFDIAGTLVKASTTPPDIVSKIRQVLEKK